MLDPFEEFEVPEESKENYCEPHPLVAPSAEILPTKYDKKRKTAKIGVDGEAESVYDENFAKKRFVEYRKPEKPEAQKPASPVPEVQEETNEEQLESNSSPDKDALTQESMVDDEKAYKDKKNDELKLLTLKNTMLNKRIGINVQIMDTSGSCVHEVALPAGHERLESLKSAPKPAKTFPFELDPFQKQAILCVDNNQSVLVSAHTSAGKTVVAGYSIAQSLALKQRVIYTTPIKALSNQKYREFYEEFLDVGLITGDATINPTASCLIMTTEILRNMLYHGSEVLKEISWVIFDEIHYMRDKERGVVWEESLILLSDTIHYVFLSATIPNARQFAEWVAYIHRQPCHVVYTDYRPTPLTHFIFPIGGEGVHMVVNEKNEFLEGNFDNAMKTLSDPKGNQPMQSQCMKTACSNMLQLVMDRKFSPVIFFSFSKKECELYAMHVSKVDFLTSAQKDLVDEIFSNAISTLSDDDKKLPQVTNVLPLLKRGIGIHHGGLLPILKETIEILFSEGLLKALFATETFAMGLNMPARTVVFTSLKKFDGQDHRLITPGEYIQMSGRAGRRGLDKRGIVIVMMDEKVSPSSARDLLCGKADPLNSAFTLSYSMILNLMRVEGINPEYVIERSFCQFQNQATVPDLMKDYQDLCEKIENVSIDSLDPDLESYWNLEQQLNDARYSLKLEYVPEKIKPFIQNGRLIKLMKDNGEELEWGVVVKLTKLENGEIEIDCLVVKEQFRFRRNGHPLNGKDLMGVKMRLHNVLELSAVQMDLPSDLSIDSRGKVAKILEKVFTKFATDVPLLDVLTDMKMNSSTIQSLSKEIVKKRKQFNGFKIKGNSLEFFKAFKEFYKKKKLVSEKDLLMKRINETLHLMKKAELDKRKKVLQVTGFSGENDIITVKGRFACELNGVHELVMTELLLCGILNELKTEEIVAFLSVFVCDERSNDNPALPTSLVPVYKKLKEIASKIHKAEVQCGIEVADEDAFLEGFRITMIDPVYKWAQGRSFLEICKETTMYEGSLIRCMKRLEEVLRLLIQAVRKLGNSVLEVRLAEAISKIKRDIVFAASLYL